MTGVQTCALPISNIGFELPADKEKEIQNKTSIFKDKVKSALRETFRPEFLNRLDEIIIFNPLSRQEIRKIVDIQLDLLKKKLAERGIKVTLDSSLKKHIAENGFDAEYGARPIKRLIQKAILDELASRIIKGEFKNAKKVKLGFQKSGLTVNT